MHVNSIEDEGQYLNVILRVRIKKDWKWQDYTRWRKVKSDVRVFYHCRIHVYPFSLLWIRIWISILIGLKSYLLLIKERLSLFLSLTVNFGDPKDYG
jgi:hypothetical protein